MLVAEKLLPDKLLSEIHSIGSLSSSRNKRVLNCSCQAKLGLDSNRMAVYDCEQLVDINFQKYLVNGIITKIYSLICATKGKSH